MAYPTNPIYKFTKSKLDGTTTGILKSCEGDRYLHIPINEANTDYQDYLACVAEGNTAEAAD